MMPERDILLTPDACTATPSSSILRWLLAGAIIALPVQIETPYDVRFAPSDLFLIVTIALGAGVWRIIRPTWSIWHLALLLLFIAHILVKNAAVGIAQTDLVNKLGGMVLLFGFYLCLTNLADRWSDLLRYLRIFVGVVALLNAVACVAFLWCRHTGTDNPVLLFLLSGSTDRLAGMLVDPNAYGGLLTIAYAILLLCQVDDSGKRLMPGWLYLISLLTLSMGLFLTSSRSAWIGFALLTVIGVLQNPRLLLLVPVVIALGIAVVVFSVGDEGFDDMVAVSSRQSTIDERLEINRNALEMFLDHPLLGGGIGQFHAEHGIIVHNSSMWFLAEFGLAGFAIFAGLIAWFPAKAFLAYRSASPGHRSVIGALVAAHIAMIGISLGIEAFYQRSWWFVMALLASANALSTREQEIVETEPSGEVSWALSAPGVEGHA